MFEINVLNTAKCKSLNYCVNAYRFGFNGKIKDDEIDGVTGSKLDFGARIYDSRIGRWLAIDPLSAKYPNLSPYCFVGNMPTVAIDPDGKDIYIVVRGRSEEDRQIHLATMEEVLNMVDETTLGGMKIEEFINNPDKNLYFALGEPGEGLDGVLMKTETGRNVKFAQMGHKKLLQIGSREFDGMEIDPDKINYFIVIDEKSGSTKHKAKIAGHEMNAHAKEGLNKQKEHEDYGETKVGKPESGSKAEEFNNEVRKIRKRKTKNSLRVNDCGTDVSKVTRDNDSKDKK